MYFGIGYIRDCMNHTDFGLTTLKAGLYKVFTIIKVFLTNFPF